MDSLSSGENVGAQVGARNFAMGDVLDSGPVLGLDTNVLVVEPIRNGLLAKPLPHKCGNGICECLLSAAADLNSSKDDFVSLRRGLLHGELEYTSRFVFSTSPCVSHSTRALVGSQSMSKEMSPLGVRAQKALKSIGKNWKNPEAEIVALLKGMVDDSDAELRERLSQQTVHNILNGRVERSYYTPFVAHALGVPCLWLAFDVGPENFGKDAPSARGARLLKAFEESEEPVKKAIEKALTDDAKPKKKSKKQAASKKTVLRVA